MRLNNSSLLREKAFINGTWVEADTRQKYSVYNPATREILVNVPDMTDVETRRAIEAASIAWNSWRDMTAKQRSVILKKWYDQILANADDLAMIMTSEQGKPLAEAKTEVLYAASFVEWFAEEGKRTYGDIIPPLNKSQRLLVLKQPIGVCAAITPWNFPCAMITRKIAPALAAGCTVVVKPAEQTPLTALALAVLAENAGFPPGVLNIITASATNVPFVGKEMTSNPIVRKLSFTGSIEVGKLLMGQCASTVKKISLELGGNAPFIVFDDADIDAAVAGAMANKYRNSGQTCICANRFIVQSKIYDVFAHKLAAKVAELKVGIGTEPGVTQGPLIDENALKKVENHIADAVSKGAKILVGGHRHPRGGTFFEPTILVNVTPNMICTQEETFGPVAPLLRFKDEEEAIKIANATEYGLAAFIYSRDIGRIWRVAEALEYGMVGVNASLIANEVAPFGGIKQSGIGREGSKYGIDEYLEIKYICLNF